MNNDFFTPLDLHQRDRALMFPPARSASPRLDPLLAALGFGSGALAGPSDADPAGRSGGAFDAIPASGIGSQASPSLGFAAQPDLSLIAAALAQPSVSVEPQTGQISVLLPGAARPLVLDVERSHPPSAATHDSGRRATDPALAAVAPTGSSAPGTTGAGQSFANGSPTSQAAAARTFNIQVEFLTKVFEKQIWKAAQEQAELIVNRRFYYRDRQREANLR